MADAQSFGKYLLMRKLAAGGMGEVFLAKQQGPEGFEKFLVVKRILSHHTDNPDYVDMFFAEARLAAKMSHSNIVQIYEMGEIEGAYFIAMEFVNGKSMKDIIDAARAKGQKLEPAHIAEMIIKLASGLGYAHNLTDMSGNVLNIIHRDINPHNALVSYGGEVKVIDFGIAKSDVNEHKTETGTIKGKFVYMSPEQSAAEKIDKRSDIFSIGIVLYEMLAGENPFQKPNIVLSLDAIQRFNPPPPSTLDEAFKPFDPIIEKVLAKKADDRYQDCAELVMDLQRLLATGEIPKATKPLNKLMQDLFKEQIEKEQRFIQDFVSSTKGTNIMPVAKPRPPSGSIRTDIAPIAEPEPEPTPAPMQLQGLTGTSTSTGVRTSGAVARRRKRRNSVYVILGIIAFVTVGVVAALIFAPQPPTQPDTPVQQIDLSNPEGTPPPPPPDPDAAAREAKAKAEREAKDKADRDAKEKADRDAQAQKDKDDRHNKKDKDKKARDKDKKDERDSKAAKEEDNGAKTVVVNETKREDKREEKREEKKAAVVDDPPQAKQSGYFTILSTPSAPVFRESARLSSGGTTKVDLNKQSGTIKVGDSTTPFIVTFAYRMGADHNVDVQIDTQPWSIVKKDGISLGRTPRPWTASDGVKRYEFVSPGQPPMTVTIKFSSN